MKTSLKNIEIVSVVEEINNINADTILLIVDHLVLGHYSKELNFDQIKDKKVIFWKAPDGEKVKNIGDFQNAVEFFLDKGIHRNSHLVVIGGGAISDFGGFIAATILRGISWSIFPTTLLSMIDASIGGKVAINSRSGKNLIGAYHMPSHIWICPKFIDSLSKTEINSGLGEVLKYCFLDYAIYNLAIKKSPKGDIINACARYKQQLVEKDFKETGIRKILNLGHSFGHALEYIYSIPHGEAVMWGMFLIFKVFGSHKNIRDITALKKSLEIPGENPPWFNKEFPVEKIMHYLSKDKKVSALGTIDMVFVHDIGNVYVERKTFNEIQMALEHNKNDLRKFTLQ